MIYRDNFPMPREVIEDTKYHISFFNRLLNDDNFSQFVFTMTLIGGMLVWCASIAIKNIIQ